MGAIAMKSVPAKSTLPEQLCYFPKGTHLSRCDADEIGAVAAVLNRQRKTRGWMTLQKPSTNTYAGSHKALLRRSVECGQ